jgi:hypothetical protein
MSALNGGLPRRAPRRHRRDAIKTVTIPLPGGDNFGGFVP